MYKAVSMFVPSSGGDTTYKCGMTCPPLSEEATEGGQQVCKMCKNDSNKPVFDFSTQT